VIIPRPARFDGHDGAFVLEPDLRLAPVPGAERAADLLAEYLGLDGRGGGSGPCVRLGLDPELPAEGYRLRIAPDGVALDGADEAGLFYGVQTLRQLVVADPADPARRSWPAATIDDAPRFGWRGAHLDVARHFMPVEFLHEFVDELALHKLNILHLHLTDDQGWRMEIDGYPLLTEVGAWRVGADGVRHGGCYTQQQLRDLVAFAARRGVEVIPEIEMPGHAVAALAAYPHLGNFPDRRLDVWTHWGVSEDIFGVHEGVFEFCETVLRQVAEVFPSQYVHIGGDECPTVQWRQNPEAVAVAEANGLGSPDELRAWFLGRIQDLLAGLGRRAVCWDEAGDGGDVGAGMTVTAWRDAAHSVRSVDRGHQVVMAPHLSTYLDYPPDDRPADGTWHFEEVVTLADAHAFDPAAGGLPVVDRVEPWKPGILGAQAQIWTEYAPTPADVRRMAYPRLCALAEAAWSDGPRDYGDFQARLAAHREVHREVGALPPEWQP
jgi:hexosaminidase